VRERAVRRFLRMIRGLASLILGADGLPKGEHTAQLGGTRHGDVHTSGAPGAQGCIRGTWQRKMGNAYLGQGVRTWVSPCPKKTCHTDDLTPLRENPYV